MGNNSVTLGQGPGNDFGGEMYPHTKKKDSISIHKNIFEQRIEIVKKRNICLSSALIEDKNPLIILPMEP